MLRAPTLILSGQGTPIHVGPSTESSRFNWRREIGRRIRTMVPRFLLLKRFS